MKQTKDLKELEGKIGYTFKDKTLFKQALTHSSYANEHRHEGLKDNERLDIAEIFVKKCNLQEN